MADTAKKEIPVVGTVNLYNALSTGYARYDTDKRDKKDATCKVVITFPVPEKGTAEEIDAFMTKNYGFGLQTALKKAVVQQLYGDNGTEVSSKIDTAAEARRLETWLQSPKARVAGPAKVTKARAEGVEEGKRLALEETARQYGFKDAAEMMAAVKAKAAAKNK